MVHQKQMTLTPEQVKAKLDQGEVLFLLDVREDKELDICRIDGATHIPMGDIPARRQELPDDQPIVCICHHGMRSASVQNFLLQQGFENVINLTGGIDAWSRTVEPEMARY